MNKAFGPREDLAYLLTIAHEYGHHIQGATGLFYARAVYLQEHPAEKLNSSRRNELQASCFGGVFTRAVANSYPLTDRRKELEFQSSNSFGDSSDTPADERRNLDMSDDDIHNLLPSALQRHSDENRDDVLPGEEYHDVTWDSPVRVMQTHFMA